MMNLKKLRSAKGWTQEQLARECELSLNHVWRLENKDVTPSLDVAKRIAAALGVTLEELG